MKNPEIPEAQGNGEGAIPQGWIEKEIYEILFICGMAHSTGVKIFSKLGINKALFRSVFRMKKNIIEG